MYLDSHCHIFSERIIKNVGAKQAMVKALKLNVDEAMLAFRPEDLDQSARNHDIQACIILPTALPEKVLVQNDHHYRISQEYERIIAFATLHPFMTRLEDEIQRSFNKGIKGFKFSSFSQRFDVRSVEVDFMLKTIQRIGEKNNIIPVVVFDTFCKADLGFGADSNHLTTPDRLAEIYKKHSGINFVGAHMGGLAADFSDLQKYLKPAPNLFLDTSNAAHTLETWQFVEILKIHGPSQILFGTDWPWFKHNEEIPLIKSLLLRAGYTGDDCDQVFIGNASNLIKE